MHSDNCFHSEAQMSFWRLSKFFSRQLPYTVTCQKIKHYIFYKKDSPILTCGEHLANAPENR